MPDSDVILVMMPPWEPKRAPLGIAYIAEYLRARGFNSRVIDFNLSLYQKSNQAKRIFWEIYNINFMSTQEIGNRLLLCRLIIELVFPIFHLVYGPETGVHSNLGYVNRTLSGYTPEQNAWRQNNNHGRPPGVMRLLDLLRVIQPIADCGLGCIGYVMRGTDLHEVFLPLDLARYHLPGWGCGS